jgi:hypothetical protein
MSRSRRRAAQLRGSSFGPQTAVNQRHFKDEPDRRAAQTTGRLQAIGAACRRGRASCHAEGRGFESHQPLPKRPPFPGLFLHAQSACGSASGRTDPGLAAGPIVGRSKKNTRFAGQFWFVRTEVLLWACRRSSVRPGAAVGRLFLQNGTFLHTDACPCAASDPDPSGRVRFQSGYREANPLCPAQHPGEPWLPPPRPHSRRRPRQRRGVRHGRVGRGNRSGFHRRGCRPHWKRASARKRECRDHAKAALTPRSTRSLLPWESSTLTWWSGWPTASQSTLKAIARFVPSRAARSFSMVF